MFRLRQPKRWAYRLVRSPLSCIPPFYVRQFPPPISPLSCRRHIHLEGIMLAPVVFGGLFVSLWTWKCFMMVTFQNKIIYMPGLPPNARWEKISDYVHRCGGLQWREERVRASDGTDLALCVTDMDLGRDQSCEAPDSILYIIYFQGPHARLPS